MAKTKSAKKKNWFEEEELPPEGSVYIFPLAGDRYGACRVLRRLPIADSSLAEWATKKVPGWCLRVALSPWVGRQAPRLNEPALQEVLTLTHHSWKGNQQLYLVTDPPDATFQYLGLLPPTAAERAQVEKILAGEWPRESWATQIVMQWDWDHLDRDQLLAQEQMQKVAASERADRAAEKRIARLSKKSLADFQRSRFLPSWSRGLHKQAVADVRQSIRDALDRMLQLGPQPKSKQLLAEVKRLILNWNQLQKKHDYFMATIERDDLCVFLADLFIVAGLKTQDPAKYFERFEDL